MTRAVAAIGALLMTGVLFLLAVTAVSWFMNSPAVWAVARHFNGLWLSIGLPFYFYFFFFFFHPDKKKPAAEDVAKFR
jgi:hypothetical protein